MLLVACIGQVGSEQDSNGARRLGTAEGTPKDPGLGSNATAALRDAASGYLLYRTSLIDPWCGAVLVDRLTVLTAAHCVANASPHLFSVGFGALGSGPTYGVSEIEICPRYSDEATLVSDIARITLREPVLDVAPAVVAPGSAERVVSIVSYRFVLAGHQGDRVVFDGRIDDADTSGLAAVFPGADTNCHGESGAGLFGPDVEGAPGALLGIASSVDYDPRAPPSACFTRLMFAPLVQNLDFVVPAKAP